MSDEFDKLSARIDSIIEKDDLTEEERKLLKGVLKVLVAVQRLGRFGRVVFLGAVVLLTNWEKVKTTIIGWFS